MNPIPPAAAIRAYEKASKKTSEHAPNSLKSAAAAFPIDEAQSIAEQYLSLDDYGRRVAKAFMASLVRLKGAK